MRMLLISAIALAPLAAAAAPSVARWDLPGIAGPMWESHPAIDPSTGDLWFVRSDRNFEGWRILTSRCGTDGRWSEPKATPFARAGLEADPYFSAGGRTLYFISTRAIGSGTSGALDIWRADRDEAGGWGVPERLPAPVNSPEAEWFPRPAPDGWLYFGSRRPGGKGKDDIWRARQDTKGTWRVENVAGLNGAGAEYEFQPAPDGRWGVLATDDGLYRIVKDGKGWRRAEKFGPTVNVDKTGIGPMIAPDGKSFVYSRDAGGEQSGELFIVRFDGAPKNWPPVCGRRP
jgi:Tol biopolymer transport system component